MLAHGVPRQCVVQHCARPSLSQNLHVRLVRFRRLLLKVSKLPTHSATLTVHNIVVVVHLKADAGPFLEASRWSRAGSRKRGARGAGCCSGGDPALRIGVSFNPKESGAIRAGHRVDRRSNRTRQIARLGGEHEVILW